MLSVGPGVDHPGPLYWADHERGGDLALHVEGTRHRTPGVDGDVEDAVAVLEDLSLIAEACGERRVIQRHGALEILDEDSLDDPRISQCGPRRTDNHGSKQTHRN
jgi:hypothetical protein